MGLAWCNSSTTLLAHTDGCRLLLRRLLLLLLHGWQDQFLGLQPMLLTHKRCHWGLARQGEQAWVVGGLSHPGPGLQAGNHPVRGDDLEAAQSGQD